MAGTAYISNEEVMATYNGGTGPSVKVEGIGIHENIGHMCCFQPLEANEVHITLSADKAGFGSRLSGTYVHNGDLKALFKHKWDFEGPDGTLTVIRETNKAASLPCMKVVGCCCTRAAVPVFGNIYRLEKNGEVVARIHRPVEQGLMVWLHLRDGDDSTVATIRRHLELPCCGGCCPCCECCGDCFPCCKWAGCCPPCCKCCEGCCPKSCSCSACLKCKCCEGCCPKLPKCCSCSYWLKCKCCEGCCPKLPKCCSCSYWLKCKCCEGCCPNLPKCCSCSYWLKCKCCEGCCPKLPACCSLSFWLKCKCCSYFLKCKCCEGCCPNLPACCSLSYCLKCKCCEGCLPECCLKCTCCAPCVRCCAVNCKCCCWTPSCLMNIPCCGPCCLRCYGCFFPCCCRFCCPWPEPYYETSPVTGEWVNEEAADDYKLRAEMYGVRAIGFTGTMGSEVVGGLEPGTSSKEHLAFVLVAFMDFLQDSRRPNFHDRKTKTTPAGLPPRQQRMLGKGSSGGCGKALGKVVISPM